MTESLIGPPSAMPDPNPNFLSEPDDPLVPPLDPLFLSASDPISMEAQGSDLGIFLDENCDFDFSIDLPEDFFDFPSDTEPSLIPDIPGILAPDIENLGNFGDQGSNEVVNNLNSCSSESGSGGREADGRSESDRPMGVHSPASSHGSGGFVSGASGTDNALSPDTCDLGFDQKAEDGFDCRSSVPKRKKEKGDSDGDSRSSKYHKSEEKTASANGEDDKRKARLMRNRESAQLSRQRKKQYVEELEGKVKSMHSTIAELNNRISYIVAENAALRQQISGAAAAAMYTPLAAPPMPYPWMPYPPYPARPYGSQVPLVPIPKLKTQSVLGSKAKRPESKKDAAKSKVKKVASISFIGIMFFIFLFGALVPFVNVNYGRNGGSFSGLSIYDSDRAYDEHMGKVLMVNGSDIRRGSGFSNGNIHSSSRICRDRGGCGGADYHANLKEQGLASALGNASEPLFASLYVPRNDKLVKIDGNLIIHSVLASEKAMASKKNASETVSSREIVLTTPGELSSALAVPEIRGNGAVLPHLHRTSEEHPKALPSSSVDGKKLHQWFHEGVSGTLMNYSMCTEVFQFDIAPGAIIPSSPSVSNSSPEHLQNATHGSKKRNRRILEGLPLPLTASELNITANMTGKESQNENFPGSSKKPSSSMVVSVLLDPREVVDPETDRVMPPKPLSRIFVVVLLDSVKYVTYSCVLPRSGFHFVAT